MGTVDTLWPTGPTHELTENMVVDQAMGPGHCLAARSGALYFHKGRKKVPVR